MYGTSSQFKGNSYFFHYMNESKEMLFKSQPLTSFHMQDKEETFQWCIDASSQHLDSNTLPNGEWSMHIPSTWNADSVRLWQFTLSYYYYSFQKSNSLNAQPSHVPSNAHHAHYTILFLILFSNILIQSKLKYVTSIPVFRMLLLSWGVRHIFCFRSFHFSFRLCARKFDITKYAEEGKRREKYEENQSTPEVETNSSSISCRSIEHRPDSRESFSERVFHGMVCAQCALVGSDTQIKCWKSKTCISPELLSRLWPSDPIYLFYVVLGAVCCADTKFI